MSEIQIFEYGKKSSLLEHYRRPPFIGESHARFIGNPHICIGDHQFFGGNPHIFIGDHKIFIGDSRFS